MLVQQPKNVIVEMVLKLTAALRKSPFNLPLPLNDAVIPLITNEITQFYIFHFSINKEKKKQHNIDNEENISVWISPH